MEKNRFPNKLKMFRRCSGYSQKKVAQMLGLSDTSTISRWEHGIAIPNTVQVFRLAGIYHTQPNELFDELWNQITLEFGLLTRKESINTNPSFYLWVPKMYWCCYATSIEKDMNLSFSFLSLVNGFRFEKLNFRYKNERIRLTQTKDKKTYRLSGVQLKRVIISSLN